MINNIIMNTFNSKLVGCDLGLDIDNIIENYKDDLEDNCELGLGECCFCNQTDLLYLISDNESDKDICITCFEIIKAEKGNSLLDKDDLEEVDLNTFMNDLEYTWLEEYDKWFCCSDTCYCSACGENDKYDNIEYCENCGNGFCCDFSYLDNIDKNICNRCFNNKEIDVVESDICSGCGDTFGDIDSDLGYNLENKLWCFGCCF